MGTKVQTILKYKNNNKIDILFSNTTSFDTLEIVQEANMICNTLEEIKEHLVRFKKFSKTAQKTEGFTLREDINEECECEYTILVEDLGGAVFGINRVKIYDCETSIKDLVKEYGSELINNSIAEDKAFDEVCHTKNGIFYKIRVYSDSPSKHKDLFIDFDSKYVKRETIEFLAETYIKSKKV